MRNAALTLPPLRRLYDFAMYHAKAHEDCRNEIDILRARHASEKEVLDLQLYVMRSDQQRAAVRNESLSAALCELKAQASDYAEQTDLCVRMFERVNSPHVTIEDLNLLYSKVAGRLTMISSEI